VPSLIVLAQDRGHEMGDSQDTRGVSDQPTADPDDELWMALLALSMMGATGFPSNEGGEQEWLERVTDHVGRMFHCRDADQRRLFGRAVLSIARHGKRARRGLGRLLDDPSASARAAAVRAIGIALFREVDVAAGSIAKLCALMSSDPSATVRADAAAALINLADRTHFPVAVPALIAAVRDDAVPEVRASAVSALCMTVRRLPQDEVPLDSLDALAAASCDPSGTVRREARDAAVEIFDDCLATLAAATSSDPTRAERIVSRLRLAAARRRRRPE
jgi:hypothetical protein